MAQQDQASPGVLKCSLLRDSLHVDESSFSFNNLNLINTGAEKLDIEVHFITPEFIDIISGKEIKASVEASRSYILPFRFGFARKTVLVAWYPVTAEIRVKQTGVVIKKTFYLRPKENNNWKASLKQSSITFTSADKEIVFEIMIQNSGNSPDVYEISFDTELQLDQPKKNLSIVLQPGTKKAVPVRILLNPKESRLIKRQAIDILVRNNAGEQKLMQQFISLIGFTYMGPTERWNKMPLVLELILQNLASSQPFTYFNARGVINLNDNSRLGIQYQSNYFYKGYSINAQIARLEYEKGRFNAGIGSIVDFNNFLVDGMGGRLAYRAKNKSIIEVLGAKGRTGNTEYYNVRMYSPSGRKIAFSSNIISNLDKTSSVNSYLALNRMDWTLNKSTRVAMEFGAGAERIKRAKLDTSLTGLQWGYMIEKAGKNFQLRSNMNWYSKNFPGFNRGFQYQLHEVKLLGEQLFAGLFLEKNYRSYNSPQDSVIRFMYNLYTSEYGLRMGFRLPKGSLTLSPGVLTQRQDSLSAVTAKMYKIGLNANFQFTNNIFLSLYSNAGQVFLDRPSVNVRSFKSFTNLMTFQDRSYGFNLLYDEGPYYYYEIKQFINEPTRFKRLQVSPFVEVPLVRWHLAYRLQLNCMREEPNRANLYLVYNNLQYSSYKKGLDVGVTGQWSVQGTEKPLVNATLRKKLSVPVLKNVKSVNLAVKLFLDNDANGKFSSGDEAVTDAVILANDALLISNKDGIITFKNIDRRPLRLDLGHISHLKGWIPKAGYSQLVMPGTAATFYVPFSKSRMITGNLLLIKDDKSYLTMDLEAIRLTAVSNTGETYTSLTKVAGEFFFNLPAGEFTISINQAVFDENFRPVETTKLADLINNEHLHLQFEIRQKKRQLNMHKVN